MNIISKIFRKFIPKYLESEKTSKETAFRYKRLWLYSVLLSSIVSIAPLTFMTILNIHQYYNTLEVEIKQPISSLVSNAKSSLEFNFEERKAALTFVINDKPYEKLSDENVLSEVFYHLKKSFGGFVDLGLINSDGTQISYTGPYELHGKNYSDHDWFNAIKLRDFYISDVFMGFRGFPHFIIAVKHEKNGKEFYILRATIDIEFINKQVRSYQTGLGSDAFLINRAGILQTPSHFYGDILEKYNLEVPKFSSISEVLEIQDESGQPFILGYAYIEQSPFIFMEVKRHRELMKNWLTLRSDLIGFLFGSIILIILVIFSGTTYMINRIREADIKRAQVFHNLEYTNKMASIGRLAAGVAHEINNPLAIINEKAGLLQDIVTNQDNHPQKEKFLGIINSILQSVDRCSSITHRFLGFAKRMDLKLTPINLEKLLYEVLGFLGKEAIYRNIKINISSDESIPSIESDRGKLQQVFLNIINNAFAAVNDGGKIDITIWKKDDERVAVNIKDNGQGIAEEHLPHIFEPFHTTKSEGTGLGLSITYDIVQKLGGNISVKSQKGEGTCFTVKLPIKTRRY